MANEPGVSQFVHLALSHRIRKQPRRVSMADPAQINVQELKGRMHAGEDFTVIGLRNPKGWVETDTVVPEATRVSLDTREENLPRIRQNRPTVAWCT